MTDRHSPWSSALDARDPDLERADDLLDQADAFLRRHRAGFGDAPPDRAREAASEPFDDEDLPILTDVVDEYEVGEVPAAPARSPAPTQADFSTPAPGAPVFELPPIASPAPAAAAAKPPDAIAAAAPAPAPSPAPAPTADARAAETVIDRLADARSRHFTPAPRTDAAPSPTGALSAEEALAQAVEHWLADELPQILARELAQISFRVNREVSTSLRTALRTASLAHARDEAARRDGNTTPPPAAPPPASEA